MRHYSGNESNRTSRFHSIHSQLRIGNSLKKRLTTAPLMGMTDDDWHICEMRAVPTKDRQAGVLFVESDGALYGTSHEISPIRDAATGRAKPIICDFCKTWQAGAQ